MIDEGDTIDLSEHAAQNVLLDMDRLMSIFQDASVGVSLTDLNGYLLRHNSALCRMLGYGDEELRGMHFSRLTHQDDVADDWSLFQELVTGRLTHYQMEKRYIRKDGETVWAKLAVALIRDTAGAPVMEFAIVEDATDEKRIREDLGRSRDQLQVILQSVDDGITLQDRTGRVIYANGAAARLTGYDSAEALMNARGEDVSGRFELTDEAGNLVSMLELPGRKVLAGEGPAEAILGFRLPESDEPQWALVKATPVLDDDGEIALAVNVFIDITEQKRVEEQRSLRLSQEQDARQRLAFLAEAGKTLASSLDYETTLGAVAHLAVSHVADWCVVDVLAPDGSIERVATAHADPEKERWAREIERRYPADREGAIRMVEAGTSVLVDVITDDMLESSAHDAEHLEILRQLGMSSVMLVPMATRGRVIGAITFISAESGRRYTTEDVSLAEELAQRAATAMDNARLYRESVRVAAEREAILGQMADSVLIVDPEGRVIFINDAGRNLLGDIGPELIRDPASRGYDLLTVRGDPLPEDQRPLVGALQGESVVNRVWRMRRKDGTQVVIQGNATPVRGEDGSLLGAVSTFRDITVQHELEEQKDAFLSLVAHELRTPLTVLHGYMQLLERRQQDEALSRPFEVMRRQVSQLTGLVAELLDLSRVEAGRLELELRSIDYSALVSTMVEELSALHTDRTIEARMPAGVEMRADPVRLRQVLINLIDNALKYGPQSGPVTITVESDEETTTTYVCDSGPPLPPSERGRIFDRFYRIGSETASAGGLGIGLSITRAIVEEHGGTIWVADHDHSSFAFSIPTASGG